MADYGVDLSMLQAPVAFVAQLNLAGVEADPHGHRFKLGQPDL